MRALLAAAMIAALPQLAAAQSPVTVSPDGQTALVQKDVGSERWAIAQNRQTRQITGNVFFSDGRPAQFLWCRWVGGISYECLGNNGCNQEPCTWSTVATVQLPDSFFAVPGGQATPRPTPRPTPGPTPAPSGLQGLLGTWDFTTAGTTFRYRLQRIVTTNDGTRGIVGLDGLNDTVVVVELPDDIGEEFDYGLLDPSGAACLFHLFFQVSTNRVAGVSALTDVVGGECTADIIGIPLGMSGVRISNSAATADDGDAEILSAPVTDSIQRAVERVLGATRGMEE